jgi:hypothetical protein
MSSGLSASRRAPGRRAGATVFGPAARDEQVGRPRIVGVAHGGSLFLIDSGRPVPNCDPTEPLVRAGWIYNRPSMKLMAGGGSLPVGTYLERGKWDEVTLPPEEIAAIEANVALLLADEQ